MGNRAVVSFTLVSLLALPLAAVAQQGSGAVCLNPPTIDAIARTDNDISFGEHPLGRPVPIPRAVKDKIDALAREPCFGARAHSDESRPLGEFYGNTFYVRGPDNLSLYVFDRQALYGYSVYFFILFDSATARLTSRPASIYGKWAQDSGDILQRPFVTFEDLDHDAQLELVVRERSHNGTVYNAAVRHYYRIGSDLALFPMLALEEKSYQDVAPRDTWLTRTVRYVSLDTLLLAAFVTVPGAGPRKVGEVFLAKNKTFGYHIAERRVVDKKYECCLVTDSGEPDNSFLLDGYTFWY
jgi:hypothetical protein